MSLGFACRAAEYKRAGLLFSDLNRLRAIRDRACPFQIVFGGKARPRDEAGKNNDLQGGKAAAVLRDSIPVVYVENRDMRDPEPSDIEIASLYDKLEGVILPKYYSQPDAFAEVMHSAIALNGSFFNTQRMLAQYMLNAYYPRASASSTSTLQDNVRTESGVASKV